MRSSVNYSKFVTKEQIEEASQMDLLTYLENYEPDNLVKLTEGIYCTKEHDSLKISNGKWMWWSRGVGGYNALSYLIKVEGMTLPQAVCSILGNVSSAPPQRRKEKTQNVQKTLELPKCAEDNKRVYAYLIKERKIDAKVVKYFVDHHYIFESLPYHNAVFVGYDNRGKARYACWRGLNKQRFMGDCTGSSKEYSFRYIGNENNPIIHIFESAIDLLSYVTLLKDNKVDWTRFNLISLAGVYQPKKNIEDSVIPIAIQKYLDEHRSTSTIYLHLDNDSAGQGASKIFKSKLSQQYKVIDNPVPFGKDVNDFLLIQKGYIEPFIYKEREMNYDR